MEPPIVFTATCRPLRKPCSAAALTARMAAIAGLARWVSRAPRPQNGFVALPSLSCGATRRHWTHLAAAVRTAPPSISHLSESLSSSSRPARSPSVRHALIEHLTAFRPLYRCQQPWYGDPTRDRLRCAARPLRLGCFGSQTGPTRPGPCGLLACGKAWAARP
jgi:hypothetical protein